MARSLLASGSSSTIRAVGMSRSRRMTEPAEAAASLGQVSLRGWLGDDRLRNGSRQLHRLPRVAIERSIRTRPPPYGAG